MVKLLHGGTLKNYIGRIQMPVTKTGNYNRHNSSNEVFTEEINEAEPLARHRRKH